MDSRGSGAAPNAIGRRLTASVRPCGREGKPRRPGGPRTPQGPTPQVLGAPGSPRGRRALSSPGGAGVLVHGGAPGGPCAGREVAPLAMSLARRRRHVSDAARRAPAPPRPRKRPLPRTTRSVQDRGRPQPDPPQTAGPQDRWHRRGAAARARRQGGRGGPGRVPLPGRGLPTACTGRRGAGLGGGTDVGGPGAGEARR